MLSTYVMSREKHMHDTIADEAISRVKKKRQEGVDCLFSGRQQSCQDICSVPGKERASRGLGKSRAIPRGGRSRSGGWHGSCAEALTDISQFSSLVIPFVLTPSPTCIHWLRDVVSRPERHTGPLLRDGRCARLGHGRYDSSAIRPPFYMEQHETKIHRAVSVHQGGHSPPESG